MKKIALLADGWKRLITYAWVQGINTFNEKHSEPIEMPESPGSMKPLILIGKEKRTSQITMYGCLRHFITGIVRLDSAS